MKKVMIVRKFAEKRRYGALCQKFVRFFPDLDCDTNMKDDENE